MLQKALSASSVADAGAKLHCEATAIISDIHGNLAAFRAVLEDIAKQNITTIYFLGDVPGPGPNSAECLDLVTASCQVALRGDCDQIDCLEPESFHDAHQSGEQRQRRRQFLVERPQSFVENDFLFVHGSARNPSSEYLFPEDIYNSRKLTRIFDRVPQYSFMGHTHVPGIFTENFEFLSPEDTEFAYCLDRRKTLCNVGSVGQPRDGDWRACYVVLDGMTIRFRKVEHGRKS
jgi:predicted phosphodiesterase